LEGLAGGLFFALLFTYLMTQFSFISPLTSDLRPLTSDFQWLLFAAITVISATFGDLAESMLKRSINIKDSGSIFPGHGGILDRFDSVLLAAPIVFIYIYLLNNYIK
jgi:phosphatidate cytidylyltransferase